MSMNYLTTPRRAVALALATLLGSPLVVADQTVILNRNSWTLVPLLTESDATVAETFQRSGVTAVFAYDAAQQSWLSYHAVARRGSLGSKRLTELLHQSLWVKTSTAVADFVVAGRTRPQIDSTQLQAGWNLVQLGGSLTTANTIRQLMAGYALQPQQLFSFNANRWTQVGDLTQSSDQPLPFDPEKGVWLYLRRHIPLAVTVAGSRQTSTTIPLGRELVATIYSDSEPHPTETITLKIVQGGERDLSHRAKGGQYLGLYAGGGRSVR